MNKKNEMKRKLRIEHWHKVAALLMTYDLVAVFISYFLALVFRFDFVFSAQLIKLAQMCNDNDENIVSLVKEIVPTYVPIEYDQQG